MLLTTWKRPTLELIPPGTIGGEILVLHRTDRSSGFDLWAVADAVATLVRLMFVRRAVDWDEVLPYRLHPKVTLENMRALELWATWVEAA